MRVGVLVVSNHRVVYRRRPEAASTIREPCATSLDRKTINFSRCVRENRPKSVESVRRDRKNFDDEISRCLIPRCGTRTFLPRFTVSISDSAGFCPAPGSRSEEKKEAPTRPV